MRLIHHPEAEAELIEAARFYERRVPTLGVQFLDAADRAIGVIQEAPERWKIIEADVRQYLIPRFPKRSTTASCRTICASSRSSTRVVTRTTGVTVSPHRPGTPPQKLTSDLLVIKLPLGNALVFEAPASPARRRPWSPTAAGGDAAELRRPARVESRGSGSGENGTKIRAI